MWYAQCFGLLCALLIFACDSNGEQNTGANLHLTDSTVVVRVADRPLLTYYLNRQAPRNATNDALPTYYGRSAFIHPVYSPGGAVVTDDFPVGHAHQHGIFTAWTKTRFRGRAVDFWNQQKETGTVRHVELLEIIDSVGVAGFHVRLEHLSLPDSTVVLHEHWHLRAYDRTAPYVFDLRSEQVNVTEDTLYLERHLYGGLGVRGNAEWNEADTSTFRQPAEFMTSEGLARDSANHSRPEWVAMYGMLARGDTAGIATLPHPQNYRGLHFVRVHPEMPYYSVTPVVEEGFKLAPGQPYLSRYRFVVFDGLPQAVDIGRFSWDRFVAR